MSAPTDRDDARVPRWALVTSFFAPVLLIGGWLIADALQPPSYDPVRQTVSVVAGAAGRDRWLMTAALLGVGVCHFATAYGLRFLRPSARISLAVAGVAGLGVALSPEPVHGSTPQHLAFTALGALVIATWPLLVAEGGRGRPVVMSVVGSAFAAAVSLALLLWMVLETQQGAELGLAERLASGAQTCWPFVVAITAYRAQRVTSEGRARRISLARSRAGGRVAALVNRDSGLRT